MLWKWRILASGGANEDQSFFFQNSKFHVWKFFFMKEYNYCKKFILIMQRMSLVDKRRECSASKNRSKKKEFKTKNDFATWLGENSKTLFDCIILYLQKNGLILRTYKIRAMFLEMQNCSICSSLRIFPSQVLNFRFIILKNLLLWVIISYLYQWNKAMPLLY